MKNASARTANRVVCYCADCQAFAQYLKRADLLDSQGGSDIVQVAPAALQFHSGKDRIAGLHLTPNALFRWYASCCNTPIGNLVSPAIPFVGIVAQAFESPDTTFGKPIGAIFGKYAIGTPPPGSEGRNLKIYARAIRMVLGWRLTGQGWPHPFFDRASGQPAYTVTTLSQAERDALRPLCGPHPSAAARA